MPDPQNPVKTTNMAMNGQAILIDDIIKPVFNLPAPGTIVKVDMDDPDPTTFEVDYSDLAEVNGQLIRLRNRFYLSRKDLKNANRAVVRTRWAYESAKKRYLIQITGGTEKLREAVAEMLAEREYGEYLVAQEVAKETEAYHRDLKSDLDLLKELSNNLRRLISDV